MCWLKSYLSRAVFVSDSEIFIRVSLRITGGETQHFIPMCTVGDD